MKKFSSVCLIGILVSMVMVSSAVAGGEWFRNYADGLKAMKAQNYESAAELFRSALKGNPKDKKKVRTYGMHFIEYFPHRELGICLYYLGDNSEALRHLQISMEQEPSPRARDFLRQLGGNVPPPKREKKVVKKQPRIEPEKKSSGDTDMIVGKKTIKLVGERMGVAVFPFENKGASRDLGDIVLDKMITVLVNNERFRVLERAQLNKVLEEQSLGVSGVLDAATAAQIGKGIGVDAIIIGSVAAAVSGAISVDARVIDTESAAIIVAQDAYSGSADAQSVKNTVENLARKITESLPLVEGFVIRIDGDRYILDAGRIAGLKKGMKCIVYKEGAVIKHPITGEVLGKETKIMGELLVTNAYDKFSEAKILESQGGLISMGDKFLTK